MRLPDREWWGAEGPLRTSFGRWELGPGWFSVDDPKRGRTGSCVRDSCAIVRESVVKWRYSPGWRDT